MMTDTVKINLYYKVISYKEGMKQYLYFMVLIIRRVIC